MGADNFMGEPLNNVAVARLAAVFKRISHLVEQTAMLERSVATRSTNLRSAMVSHLDEFQTTTVKSINYDRALARVVKTETTALKVELPDVISTAVIKAISTTLCPRLEGIEIRLARIEQRTKKLSEAMVPWWKKLWDRIASCF